MDGSIAVIFAVIGLFDMNMNYCPTGCLARNDTDARFTVQVGQTHVNDVYGEEITLGYDFGHARGPFQPSVALGVSAQGDVFIGSGFKWRIAPYRNSVFYEGSTYTGLHFEDGGPDLGGDIQFKAALGVGYEFDNGGAVLVSWDHRSNAGLNSTNPGMESLTFQYSMAFN